MSKHSSLNERVNSINVIDQLNNSITQAYVQNTNMSIDQRSRSQYSKQSSSKMDSDANFFKGKKASQQLEQELQQQLFVTGLLERQRAPHIETQQKLEKCVDGIEDQFGNVLNRHENDFVNAYRGHMVKVQKELQYLRNKASETAGKILNDDSITNLQDQIGRFKSAAINLDRILEIQKREVQKLKSKELNINEDRKFLKEQTKDAMKHNKLLQVALKKTTQQNKLIREFLEKNKVKRPRPGSPDRCQLSPRQIINQTMAQFREPFITQQVPTEINDQNIPNNNQDYTAKNLLQMQKNMISHEMLSQDSQDFKIKEFVQDLFKRGYSKEKIELKIAKFFKLYDLSRDERIDTLQRRLENQKRNNLKIKNYKAQDYSEKSEIENLFLDCVDECKRDLLKKKAMNASQAKFSNNMIVESTSSDHQALMEQVILNKETLITVFEQVFGTGGFVGAAIGNLEHQLKNKKFSLGANQSISYFSNATTKENQSEEAERFHQIMTAPIENLINNMSEFSNSQTRIGIRKFSNNDTSIHTNKRAQTAGGGQKYSSQVNTALTYYNDSAPIPEYEPDRYITNIRAVTSHSQKRDSFLVQGDKSRQNNIKPQSSSKERSFSVKNGKLVMNHAANMNISIKQ
ncbi:UNKNOWN [Stylonychia lemnae]|uniref:Myosin heavy chain n=1 Tax=Stylonychia lemnae TaxID=5949 RepID=A0A078BC17_STYLE|nr:UNKNOWN [Stylonychia lemnae]|eukprot:CDW90797.1 UNKNOWN [Stylonychia lemnae]